MRLLPWWFTDRVFEFPKGSSQFFRIIERHDGYAMCQCLNGAGNGKVSPSLWRINIGDLKTADWSH